MTEEVTEENYQLSSNQNMVIRLSDGAWIPCDAANADYRLYLAWVDGGNQPLDAQ